MRHFQQTKYMAKPPLDLLQPIAPPSAVRENIATNFIISLPIDEGQTVILVVLDCFSKAAYFKLHLPIFQQGKQLIFSHGLQVTRISPKYHIGQRSYIKLCKILSK